MREPYRRTRHVVHGTSALRKAARDGKVNVTCWCEREVVRVPLDRVRHGQTLPCGHRTCHA